MDCHKTLLIASHNPDKIKEIAQIISPLGFQIFSMQDFPDIAPVIEDCDTISGNAMKKALEVAKQSGMLTMADDTGFFIEALGGEPGVFAARFAGENCSYADNQDKALHLMENIANRKAIFKTVIALAMPDGIIALHQGSVSGNITHEKRGKGGFGYDPIFEVEDTGKTYAEMTDSEKNLCSHRAKALQSMIPFLQDLLKSNP